MQTIVEPSANFRIRVHDRLEELGIAVKLSNSTRTKTIAEARIKTEHTTEQY